MNSELQVKPDSNLSELYDRDFYLWVQTTVQLLQERRLDRIDFESLIEEVESMGKREKKELKSRLTTLIEHLLKLKYWESEKANKARGWRQTVVEQRRQIQYLLEDSPSLKVLLIEIWTECYGNARKDIIRKYRLEPELFPPEAGLTLDDILDDDYIPE
ncbi:DUF29 domain-containing protein [Roseofilum reptotaenium CS-1145]|uniref:DUF29 domain-containing protein n=1 Tax=Roseofilum reptotaenium AO1-A TaxID=1925591 RepID=A0A1L9QL82_9CYAN|nr:DUF29 domain-containing protein [Roseofilum reptotaenium]MDB9517163.1 DUF29 domain-containing protein [Roseofilum reptotaenium CS-1145]OJJ18980.1 hypothetical protein BI308_22155 [Roseofilum reptotaenium AO1-A]